MASTCRVVNLYHEPFDVYIGRGRCPSAHLPPGVDARGIWGNKFVIGEVYKGMTIDRDLACDLHEDWILYAPGEGMEILRQRIRELAGKRLGCYCFPKRCHGNILAELANKYAKDHR